MTTTKQSTEAAKQLLDALTSGEVDTDADPAGDEWGATDCPEGCTVEPDGQCSHGYLSAGRTAHLI